MVQAQGVRSGARREVKKLDRTGVLYLSCGEGHTRRVMSAFVPTPLMIVVFSLVVCHALCTAQHIQCHILKLDAQVLRNHLTARKRCDVFQHGPAAIAEARSLHSTNLEAAAQLVDHEGGFYLPFLSRLKLYFVPHSSLNQKLLHTRQESDALTQLDRECGRDGK
jgi:hypothetical protein